MESAPPTHSQLVHNFTRTHATTCNRPQPERFSRMNRCFLNISLHINLSFQELFLWFKRYKGNGEYNFNEFFGKISSARERALRVHEYRCVITHVWLAKLLISIFFRCLKEWRFMESRLAAHPQYPYLLNKLRSGSCFFLDVGCCMGTDLRRYDYCRMSCVIFFSPQFIPPKASLQKELHHKISLRLISSLISIILDLKSMKMQKD